MALTSKYNPSPNSMWWELCSMV